MKDNNNAIRLIPWQKFRIHNLTPSTVVSVPPIEYGYDSIISVIWYSQHFRCANSTTQIVPSHVGINCSYCTHNNTSLHLYKLI